MKSFAYIRPKQDVPLYQQFREIERYAERHHLQIIRWFVEESGVSAMKPRPVFSRLLRELKAGKASNVVTDRRDRFSRNVSEWPKLGELANAGIRFHFSADRKERTLSLSKHEAVRKVFLQQLPFLSVG